MSKYEKTGSNSDVYPQNMELWPQIEALTQDSLHNPENLTTLAEHEISKQSFLEAREDFIVRFKDLKKSFSDLKSNDLMTWSHFADWAFNPLRYIQQNVSQATDLNLESMQFIKGVSDSALEALLKHRQLTQIFSQLSPIDKRSLRPSEIVISWSPYDYLTRASADISNLILGDAADRYLKQVFSGNNIRYQDAHLYSHEIGEVMGLRFSCLDYPLKQLWDKLPLDYHRDQVEILRSYEANFRRISGEARDNGDIVFWHVASRHLDPKIMSDNLNGLNRDSDQVELRLYLT